MGILSFLSQPEASTEHGMTGLEFTASIVSSLFGAAWPIAFFGAVFLFKRQIRVLILRIKKLSGFGGSAEMIDEALGEAFAQAELLTPSPDGTKEKASSSSMFESLLSISPPAAVLEKWKEIESWILAQMPPSMPPTRIWKLITRPQELVELGLLDYSGVSLLNDLKTIRNAAAHAKADSEITRSQAEQFGILADQLMSSKKYGEP